MAFAGAGVEAPVPPSGTGEQDVSRTMAFRPGVCCSQRLGAGKCRWLLKKFGRFSSNPGSNG